MKKLLYRDRWEIVLLIVVSALLILLGLRTTAANCRSLADSMSSYQKLIAGYDSQIKNAKDADTRAALIGNKSGTEEMLVDLPDWAKPQEELLFCYLSCNLSNGCCLKNEMA